MATPTKLSCGNFNGSLFDIHGIPGGTEVIGFVTNGDGMYRPVPAPATLVFVLLGLVGIVAAARMRSRTQSPQPRSPRARLIR